MDLPRLHKIRDTLAAEHEVWFRRQVQVGLDSANAGNLVPAEDVEAEFAKRREQTRQKLKAKP